MSTKFLLTSHGITNGSIKSALLSLAGGSFSDKNLLFIPTAQNPKITDKSRLIQYLVEFKNLGFKSIDMIDIAVPDKKIADEKIKKADIICFSGGNTLYLKTKLYKNGLLQNFQKVFSGKIIVGISAGSIVWGKNIKGENDVKKLENLGITEVYNGEEYNIFDFIFIPHLNRAEFPQCAESALQDISKERKETIYALDDESALLIDGERREIISEGYYKIYN